MCGTGGKVADCARDYNAFGGHQWCFGMPFVGIENHEISELSNSPTVVHHLPVTVLKALLLCCIQST